MTNLVLSLFPGIGLFDRAFEEEGFCIVRGPDILWGGDVRTFHPPAGRFDGVIGGPPCQAFSSLVHIVRHRYGDEAVADNLIPEFERIVAEAAPTWFVMENVPAAPEPSVPGYCTRSVKLNNRWFGAEQERKRRFAFGLHARPVPDPWRYIELATLESAEWSPAVLAQGKTKMELDRGGKPKNSSRASQLRTLGYVNRTNIAEYLRLQGLPPDYFDHSPLTVEGKTRMLGNGVPLPLGRAVARALKAMIAELERVA